MRPILENVAVEGQCQRFSRYRSLAVPTSAVDLAWDGDCVQRQEAGGDGAKEQKPRKSILFPTVEYIRAVFIFCNLVVSCVHASYRLYQ